MQCNLLCGLMRPVWPYEAPQASDTRLERWLEDRPFDGRPQHLMNLHRPRIALQCNLRARLMEPI
jgi:hypothetical protein